MSNEIVLPDASIARLPATHENAQKAIAGGIQFVAPEIPDWRIDS